MSEGHRYPLVKRKHSRKGEKEKQGPRTKVQANKQPNRGRPQRGKGTIKNGGTLHQSLEANQLKKERVRQTQ